MQLPRKYFLAGAVAGTAVCARELVGLPARAESPALKSKHEVAHFSSSGVVLKDHVCVSAYPDPKVNGVTLYVSCVKDSKWFSDPATSSISIAQTGDISFSSQIDTSMQGEDVIKESKNLFFKSSRVRRVYDQDAHALLYIAYNTRVGAGQSGDQNKTSLSVVSLPDSVNPLPSTI